MQDNLESKTKKLMRKIGLGVGTVFLTVAVAASALADKIYFTRGNDIWRMNDDGSNQEEVYSKKGWKSFAPSVSPDGNLLAFNSEREGEKNTRDVYIFDLETRGEPRNLTGRWNPNGKDTYPDWSPDGQNIVFTGEKNGNSDIYVISVNDGTLRRLTTDVGLDLTPQYSLKGNKIVYANGKSFSDLDILVMNTDGSNKEVVVRDSDRSYFPSWSPDNNSIAYQKDEPKNKKANIFLFDLKTGQESQITRNKTNSRMGAAHPSFSADGNYIVFSQGKGNDDINSYEILVYNRKTGTITPLTNNRIADRFPSWN